MLMCGWAAAAVSVPPSSIAARPSEKQTHPQALRGNESEGAMKASPSQQVKPPEGGIGSVPMEGGEAGGRWHLAGTESRAPGAIRSRLFLFLTFFLHHKPF